MEALFFTVFGAAMGSFGNVVIHRLPRNRSLMRPGSHCVRCRKPVRWFDNVPVFSWLILRGRCRSCRQPISARYPIVEAAVAALGYLLWARYGPDQLWTALTLICAAALVMVAMIDWDTFLIPDELSLGLLAMGLLVSPFNPLFAGNWYSRAAVSGLGAASGFLLCAGIAYAGKWFFEKDAMGGGDVKLLAAVGAWSGALGAYDCLVVGSFFGAAYGGVLLLRGSVQKSDPIPFGPFLAMGALLNLFVVLPFGFPLSI